MLALGSNGRPPLGLRAELGLPGDEGSVASLMTEGSRPDADLALVGLLPGELLEALGARGPDRDTLGPKASLGFSSISPSSSSPSESLLK